MTYKARVKLADNIHNVLIEKGMQVKELVIRTKYSGVTISRYLNAHTSPRLCNLAAIARSLGVYIIEIIKGITLKEMADDD